jgi:hypothetical protein
MSQRPRLSSHPSRARRSSPRGGANGRARDARLAANELSLAKRTALSSRRPSRLCCARFPVPHPHVCFNRLPPRPIQLHSFSRRSSVAPAPLQLAVSAFVNLKLIWPRRTNCSTAASLQHHGSHLCFCCSWQQCQLIACRIGRRLVSAAPARRQVLPAWRCSFCPQHKLQSHQSVQDAHYLPSLALLHSLHYAAYHSHCLRLIHGQGSTRQRCYANISPPLTRDLALWLHGPSTFSGRQRSASRALIESGCLCSPARPVGSQW